MPVGRKRKFATANFTGHQQETRGKRSKKTEDSAVTQTSVAVRKGTCRLSKREKKGKKEKAKECIVISSSSEDEESPINKKAVKDSNGTGKPTCRRSKRQKDGVKKSGDAGESALISTRLNVKRTAAKKAERGGNATTKKATGRRSRRKKKVPKKSSEESRVMPASLNVKRSVY